MIKPTIPTVKKLKKQGKLDKSSGEALQYSHETFLVLHLPLPL